MMPKHNQVKQSNEYDNMLNGSSQMNSTPKPQRSRSKNKKRHSIYGSFDLRKGSS